MALRRAAHSLYDTQYHIVGAPKYRKKILQGEIRERIHEVLHEIALAYDIVIEELEVSVDHVHVFCSFPPRLSISQFVNQSSCDAIQKSERTHHFSRTPSSQASTWGGEFWEDGYFVRTVGDKVTAELIKKYIQHHQQDRDNPQLKLF